jgi:hypothetical protein
MLENFLNFGLPDRRSDSYGRAGIVRFYPEPQDFRVALRIVQRVMQPQHCLKQCFLVHRAPIILVTFSDGADAQPGCQRSGQKQQENENIARRRTAGLQEAGAHGQRSRIKNEVPERAVIVQGHFEAVFFEGNFVQIKKFGAPNSGMAFIITASQGAFPIGPLLHPVFRLRVRGGLPLHVAGFIGPAVLQRLHMVDDVAATGSRSSAKSTACQNTTSSRVLVDNPPGRRV